MHPSITTDRVIDACERSTFDLENIGICISCGNEQNGCEPDARKYKCESCGKRAVYGAEELLLMMA